MRVFSRKRNLAFGATVCIGVAIAVAVMLTAFASAKSSSARRKVPAVSGQVTVTKVTVRRGGTVRGTVVFHNRTGKVKVLFKRCPADGMFAVDLKGTAPGTRDPSYGSLAVACRNKAFIAKPGRTDYRFKTRATYMACLHNAATVPKSNKNWLPRCTGPHHYQSPGLPAGRYKAVFLPGGTLPRGVHVRPAAVTIVKHTARQRG